MSRTVNCEFHTTASSSPLWLGGVTRFLRSRSTTYLESPLASELDNLDDSAASPAATSAVVRSSTASEAAAAVLSASGRSLDRRLFSPAK